MHPDLILTALLALLPGPQSRCIERHRPQIVAAAVSGERDRGVPAAVLLVVGFAETHLGCDAGEGGGWGAPIDMRHRHQAGTSDHAARALARSYAVCGTWAGAIGRFRSGLCTPWQLEHRAYVRRVLRIATRLNPSWHRP